MVMQEGGVKSQNIQIPVLLFHEPQLCRQCDNGKDRRSPVMRVIRDPIYLSQLQAGNNVAASMSTGAGT